MGGRLSFTTVSGEKREPTEQEMIQLQARIAMMGGTFKHPPSGGKHSLQEYQAQVMVMERQQHKRRFQHARNEISTRGDEYSGGPLNRQLHPQGGPGGLQLGHPHFQGGGFNTSMDDDIINYEHFLYERDDILIMGFREEFAQEE